MVNTKIYRRVIKIFFFKLNILISNVLYSNKYIVLTYNVIFTSKNNVYHVSHLFEMLKFRLNVFETIDFPQNPFVELIFTNEY